MVWRGLAQFPMEIVYTREVKGRWRREWQTARVQPGQAVLRPGWTVAVVFEVRP